MPESFMQSILHMRSLHLCVVEQGQEGSFVKNTWFFANLKGEEVVLGKCRQIAFSIARFLDLGSGVTQARGRGVDRGRASGVKGVGGWWGWRWGSWNLMGEL